MSKPCGCPEEKYPGLGDDDRFAKVMKSSLIEAMTPVDFTITIKIKAAGNLETIGSIIEEFQDCKNDPCSDEYVLQLTQELDDITLDLNHIKDDLTTAIESTLEDWDRDTLDLEATFSVK